MKQLECQLKVQKEAEKEDKWLRHKEEDVKLVQEAAIKAREKTHIHMMGQALQAKQRREEAGH